MSIDLKFCSFHIISSTSISRTFCLRQVQIQLLIKYMHAFPILDQCLQIKRCNGFKLRIKVEVLKITDISGNKTCVKLNHLANFMKRSILSFIGTLFQKRLYGTVVIKTDKRQQHIEVCRLCCRLSH